MKPSIPKGTRDFSPTEVVRRTYIFNTIRAVFQKFGYQPIETPVMENLSTLTGKYGDEGDKLMFKVLNSGDFTAKTDILRLKEGAPLEPNKLAGQICEKALRYDLTVPFARYVVMHHHELAMPFKRYQIQPVWRADRPQKGRYREFYQCDADVVGSDSLLNEAEFICIYDEALSKLGLKDFSIKINNRKILSGIAELIGKPELIVDMTVAIDKLDKIGFDEVVKELITRGFTTADVETLRPFIELKGSNVEKLSILKNSLSTSAVAMQGLAEMERIFIYMKSFPLQHAKVELDITLARGLNYYTGAIFEVKSNEVQMGSIGGGGRYDDLTGMFGLKNIAGAGISFGADRIYDVLLELNLFPAAAETGTTVLITNFDAQAELYALPILAQLRKAGIAAELYPSAAKLQKQMKYADAKRIPFVLLIGEEEIKSDLLTLKNMDSGKQEAFKAGELIQWLVVNSQPTPVSTL